MCILQVEGGRGILYTDFQTAMELPLQLLSNGAPCNCIGPPPPPPPPPPAMTLPATALHWLVVHLRGLLKHKKALPKQIDSRKRQLKFQHNWTINASYPTLINFVLFCLSHDLAIVIHTRYGAKLIKYHKLGNLVYSCSTKIND